MLHNLMFHLNPPPRATQGPNCILNSTLQQNEKHMHNEHI